MNILDHTLSPAVLSCVEFLSTPGTAGKKGGRLVARHVVGSGPRVGPLVWG